MASSKEIQTYVLNLIQDEHELGNVETALAKLAQDYPDKYINSILKLTEFILPKGIELTTLGDKVGEANIELSKEQFDSLIDSL